MRGFPLHHEVGGAYCRADRDQVSDHSGQDESRGEGEKAARWSLREGRLGANEARQTKLYVRAGDASGRGMGRRQGCSGNRLEELATARAIADGIVVRFALCPERLGLNRIGHPGQKRERPASCPQQQSPEHVPVQLVRPFVQKGRAQLGMA